MDHPSTRRSLAQHILVYLHYAAPIILLSFFLLAFTLRSILTANNTNPVADTPSHTLGPGGKPLPKKLPVRNKDIPFDFTRSRKLLFDWLSVFTALTFVANATNVILHALVAQDEGWWCGKAAVVRTVAYHSEVTVAC